MKTVSGLISVIMPAYNAEKYIAAAIESILNQTHKHLELIVIDDCSTDTTGMIAEQYAKKDKRMVIIHGKKKLYEVGARNLGLEISKGEYIAWQDADDIAMPQRLAKQLAYLIKNKNIGVVGAYIEFIGHHGKKIIKEDYTAWFKQILHQPQVNQQGLNLVTMPPTYLFKKSILKNLAKPYFRPITLGLDMDIQFRLMEKNVQIVNLPDALYRYRLHGAQLTNRKYDLAISLSLIRYAAICRQTFDFDPLDFIFKKYDRIDGRHVVPILVAILKMKAIPRAARKKIRSLTIKYLLRACLMLCYAAMPFVHKPWRAVKKLLGR